MAFIIETGCWGCDGGPAGLVRVYRTLGNEVRTDNLLEALQNSLPKLTYDTPTGPQQYAAPITGHAETQDASVIAVSFCVQGSCGSGGLTEFDANSQSDVFRSYDGGVTWLQLGSGGPTFAVSGVFSDGRVLMSNLAEASGRYEYSILPDNALITPPSGAQRPIIASDQIIWVTNDGRMLLADGTDFYAPPDGNADIYHRFILGSFSGTEKGSAIVSWETGGDVSTIALLEMSGGRSYEVARYEVAQLRTLAWVSPAKDDPRLVITLVPDYPEGTRSPQIAVVDLNGLYYQVIDDPALNARNTGRTYVRAVQLGPFARVVNTGSCLNIRADPSFTGAVLTCASDGVLLPSSGLTQSAEGTEWVSVQTRAGPGWASADFLER